MKSFRELTRAARHTLLYRLLGAAFALVPKIPRSFGLRLFGMLGTIAFMVPHGDKRRTIDHLRFIFGSSWTEAKIRRTARGVYRSLGMNAFDAIKLRAASDAGLEGIVRTDDQADLRAAYAEGRGIIAITGHVGCFEMLLHYFSRHGITCFAIGRSMFDARIEALVRGLRSGPGIIYLNRDGSGRDIIRYLRQGMMFGALIDQHIRAEALQVSFLGKPAFTVSGPVKTAMRLKIPAFVITTARQPDSTQYIYISKRLDLADTGDFEKDLYHNVQMANDRIGATIMKFPEQWVWMHRRWREHEDIPH
jgi:KDO2-lipid IV(A) lauroyltransferase